jgi:hypothetical protein
LIDDQVEYGQLMKKKLSYILADVSLSLTKAVERLDEISNHCVMHQLECDAARNKQLTKSSMFIN